MIDHQRVMRTMRTILREQVTFSYMPRPTVNFIFDNNLLHKTLWPAWCISLTPTGKQYLIDHQKE